MSFQPWFEVDKEGLRKVLLRRGVGFVLLELIQNALDERGVTAVNVSAHPVPNRPLVTVVVADDAPEGFRDLSHAWTLYAESYKKGDPNKRGRFDVGEKLVLALAIEAEILTTTGGVAFTLQGRRKLRRKTERGSVVTVTLRLTRGQMQEMLEAAGRLIVPEGIAVTLNGEPFRRVQPVRVIDGVPLYTEIGDDDGVLRRSTRKTSFAAYEPLDDTGAWVCEMGVPVVPFDGRWTIDVHQRVPLNVDRDNVTSGFLRQLRVAVLNHLHDKLGPDEAAQPWVREASASPDVEPEALEQTLDLRLGKNRIGYDPSDPEAFKRGVAAGFAPVHGGSLSRGEWDNVKRFRDDGHGDFIPAASRTRFQTPRPLSGTRPARLVPPDEWAEGMERVVRYARRLGAILLGTPPQVQIIRETGEPFAGCYSRGQGLILNLARIGHRRFNGTSRQDLEWWTGLILHEYGHHFCGDHLSDDYHKALTSLGSKLAVASLEGRLVPDGFELSSERADDNRPGSAP